MTDSHCHVSCGDPSVREFLIGRDFIGVHPWETAELGPEDVRRKTEDLASRLASSVFRPSPCLASSVSCPSPRLGVGEIGLDRLKQRDISPQMREMFEAQLRLALEFRRPVVLHGAKCWGQVVRTVQRLEIEHHSSDFATQSDLRSVDISNNPNNPSIEQSNNPNNRAILPLLFHGFSRSDGLIPDIVALGGYISVGPAVLNDHAVNYRELVRKIPLDRLLLETDRTEANAAECPSVREVAAKVAELRGLSLAELEARTDRNANDFISNVPDSLAFARSVRDNRISDIDAGFAGEGRISVVDAGFAGGGIGEKLTGPIACRALAETAKCRPASAVVPK